jgi:hypothetical protein
LLNSIGTCPTHCPAAKLFKIDRKRVREWCKNKSAIENGQKSQKRLPGGGRPVRYKEIDNKLMAWFREKRDAVVRVTKNLSTQSSTMDVERCVTCVDLLNAILCRFLNLSNQPSDCFKRLTAVFFM